MRQRGDEPPHADNTHTLMLFIYTDGNNDKASASHRLVCSNASHWSWDNSVKWRWSRLFSSYYNYAFDMTTKEKLRKSFSSVIMNERLLSQLLFCLTFMNLPSNTPRLLTDLISSLSQPPSSSHTAAAAGDGRGCWASLDVILKHTCTDNYTSKDIV